MEIEVMLPSHAHDFNFDSNCTSPYLTAPSSPQRFAGTFFYSAPTSPGRATTTSAVPFTWEEKPGTPKSEHEFPDTDFAFDFSGNLDSNSLPPADQLFDGGKIRPLKPPPKFHYDQNSPKSPRSPTKLFPFSPRRRTKPADFDPFTAALEKTRKSNSRGRDRAAGNPPGAARNKPSRSLSPFRVSDLLFENNSQSSSSSIFSSSFWYKKWKIKDLLLFRSASESRATDKKQMKKYTMLKKASQDEDVRNSSFRSTDSVGSSRRRSSGPSISAHELHYTVNRAVSEEMKKRTSLPYKQGLLGCLGFHPTGPDISRGLGPTGSSSRGL